MSPLVLFVAYSLFCFWVIFRGGAEALAGSRTSLLGRLAGTLSAEELRLYVSLSWLAGLAGCVFLFGAGGVA